MPKHKHNLWMKINAMDHQTVFYHTIKPYQTPKYEYGLNSKFDHPPKLWVKFKPSSNPNWLGHSRRDGKGWRSVKTVECLTMDTVKTFLAPDFTVNVGSNDAINHKKDWEW